MKDSIALVTGASRGLGYATALALAARGAHVIALARTSGALEELADAIEAAGGTSTLVPLDLTDEGGLQRMGLAIHERWGRLDLLVHCAIHAPPLAPLPQATEKDLARTLAINVHATQRLIVMCDPLLQAAAAGTAVFVHDDRAGQKFFGLYGASKAAQAALVASYAAEASRIGPRVLGFTPAPMPTATRARFFPGEDRGALSPCKAEAERLLALLGNA